MIAHISIVMIFVIRRHFSKANSLKKGSADTSAIKLQRQTLHSGKKPKSSGDASSGLTDGRRVFDFRTQREKIDLQSDQFISGRFTFNTLKGIGLKAEDEEHVDLIWKDYEAAKAKQEGAKLHAYLKSRKEALEFLACTSHKLYLLALREERSFPPTSRRPPSLTQPVRLPFS